MRSNLKTYIDVLCLCIHLEAAFVYELKIQRITLHNGKTVQ